MTRNVLITGGAGFIGVNLAHHYLRSGHHVIVVDNFSRIGTEGNVRWLEEHHGERLRVVRLDLRQTDGTLRQLIEEVDTVFHLAAQVAVSTSVDDPREDFESNAVGTFNVLEAVRQSTSKPIVVYSSTNKVYGDLADVVVAEQNGRYEFADLPMGIPENQPVAFSSPYGCSKGAGDQYCVDYARVYGLRTVVFRQSCIYGPHQYGVEDQGWLAWFALRAVQQLPITIYGDGKQVRDLLYIDDLIAAYDAAIDQIDRTAGQIYNIGGGPENTLSLLELIDLLKERFGLDPKFSFQAPRHGDQPVFVCDNRKAQTDLGWAPKVTPGEGLEHLLEWIRQNIGNERLRQAANATSQARRARTKRLSVVIPAKDEEETLPMVLGDLYRTIPTLHGYDTEVICVDDGSTDRTAEIAESFGARVVPNDGKHGKGMALRAGFQAATGELLLMLDADYSHRPEEIPQMLEAFRDDVGLVIGSRVFGGSEEYTHVRAFGNVFLSGALGVFTGRYLSDALNGFKLFRRDTFDDFRYTSSAFEIEIEIIANTMRKGYRIAEIPSHERARAGGMLKSRVVRHGTRFLLRIMWESFRGVSPISPGSKVRSTTAGGGINEGVGPDSKLA